jgi:hypothetical protein
MIEPIQSDEQTFYKIQNSSKVNNKNVDENKGTKAHDNAPKKETTQ